jgi:hypothetical protein
MKRLFILSCIFGMAGRMFAANQCVEHNIYLSEAIVKVATSQSARCKAGLVGGIQYNCPHGSAGMTAWGFDIPSACFTNWVSYAVQTPDHSADGHYDLGLYYIKGPSAPALAGHLMVHTGQLSGTGFAAHAGLTTVTWAGTADCSIPCTLPAGQYALALATDCFFRCAILWGDDNHGYMSLFNVYLGGTAGTAVNPSLLPVFCPTGQPPSCTFYMTTGLPSAIAPPATDPAMPEAKYPNAPIVLIY